MVEDFQHSRSARVLILSLKAGGAGLNLTAASNVIHYDLWWNPAVEDQATDRAHRIGQERPVQVRKFMCTGTLEERIDRVRDLRDFRFQVVELGATANEEQVAEIWNARFKLGSVPIFYSPYLQLPVGDKRRSGFLIPNAKYSTKNGVEFLTAL